MKSAAVFVHMFILCNSIEAMRGFYVKLLGMEESYCIEGEYLDVNTAGIQLLFFKHETEVLVPSGWSWQPGWEGGIETRPSFSVRVPEEEFPGLVERIRELHIPRYNEYPEWRNNGYWGYTIKDPMGLTLELFVEPAERPNSTLWPTEQR